MIRYVDKTGSDSNNGIIAPFLTIAHGLSVSNPLDFLYVNPGTYAESLFDLIPTGVSLARNPLFSDSTIVKPNSGQRVLNFSGVFDIFVARLILDATNITIDCAKITSGSHHITLEDCELMNAPQEHGLIISGVGSDFNEVRRCKIHNNGIRVGLDHQVYIQTSNNIIENCELYDGPGYGIHQYDGIINGNIYRRNLIRNLTGNIGILISSGSNNQVYYNIIRDCGIALEVNYGEQNSVIYNNTCFAGDGGIHIEGRNQPVTGTVIRNNICHGSVFYGLRNNGSNGNTVDHNILSVVQIGDGSTDTYPSNQLGVNPAFVSTSDLHLQAGSPAIGAGLNLGIPFDFENRPTSNPPSIGALEFTTAPSPPRNLRRSV